MCPLALSRTKKGSDINLLGWDNAFKDAYFDNIGLMDHPIGTQDENPFAINN
jgi:hypothetical protein